MIHMFVVDMPGAFVYEWYGKWREENEAKKKYTSNRHNQSIANYSHWLSELSVILNLAADNERKKHESKRAMKTKRITWPVLLLCTQTTITLQALNYIVNVGFSTPQTFMRDYRTVLLMAIMFWTESNWMQRGKSLK